MADTDASVGSVKEPASASPLRSARLKLFVAAPPVMVVCSEISIRAATSLIVQLSRKRLHWCGLRQHAHLRQLSCQGTCTP